MTGAHEALGSWDPSNGVALEWRGGVWATKHPVHLAPGTRVEFKFTCVGPGFAEWEKGPNRVLEVPEGEDDLHLRGRFGGDVELHLDRPRPAAQANTGDMWRRRYKEAAGRLEEQRRAMEAARAQHCWVMERRAKTAAQLREELAAAHHGLMAAPEQQETSLSVSGATSTAAAYPSGQQRAPKHEAYPLVDEDQQAPLDCAVPLPQFGECQRVGDPGLQHTGRSPYPPCGSSPSKVDVSTSCISLGGQAQPTLSCPRPELHVHQTFSTGRSSVGMPPGEGRLACDSESPALAYSTGTRLATAESHPASNSAAGANSTSRLQDTSSSATPTPCFETRARTFAKPCFSGSTHTSSSHQGLLRRSTLGHTACPAPRPRYDRGEEAVELRSPGPSVPCSPGPLAPGALRGLTGFVASPEVLAARRAARARYDELTAAAGLPAGDAA
mmetsp:Transcript_71252/g.201970  ORF Transcript_71252/g.201970 Transcript_71252/m.201970 type:complete len:442 (-) Transcript_71252:71-1396(-)